ncbi:MAG: polyprenyl diphosphate synthase [Burkholderiales bacterium]
MASSTQEIPHVGDVPRHVAIIMDGNGRWAKRRFLPRVAGHRKGVEAVRNAVKACAERGIEALTLFAFSSENWRRPAEEVSMLMQLFVSALQQEVERLHQNGIRFRVIGDISPLDASLVELIRNAQKLTSANTGLTLTVAANYGGRWDIMQAVERLRREHGVNGPPWTETQLLSHLCLGDLPEPDLFIRTGGEQRISNFMLWQLAYTELYFTDTLWPDFDADALDLAIASYRGRERRFGRTSEQLAATGGAADRKARA